MVIFWFDFFCLPLLMLPELSVPSWCYCFPRSDHPVPPNVWRSSFLWRWGMLPGLVLPVVGLSLALPSTAVYLCIGEANLRPMATKGFLPLRANWTKIPLSTVLSHTLSLGGREYSSPQYCNHGDKRQLPSQVIFAVGCSLRMLPTLCCPLMGKWRLGPQAGWEAMRPLAAGHQWCFPLLSLSCSKAHGVDWTPVYSEQEMKLLSLLLLNWDSGNTRTESPSSFVRKGLELCSRRERWVHGILSGPKELYFYKI